MYLVTVHKSLNLYYVGNSGCVNEGEILDTAKNLYLMNALNHSCVWRKDDSMHCKHTLPSFRPHRLSPHGLCWHCVLPGRSRSELHRAWDPVLWLSPGCRSSCNRQRWGFVQPCAERKNTWEWDCTWAVELMAKQIILDWTVPVGKVFLSACDGPQWLLPKSGWSSISVHSLVLLFLSYLLSFINGFPSDKRQQKHLLKNYFFVELLALQVRLKCKNLRKKE